VAELAVLMLVVIALVAAIGYGVIAIFQSMQHATG